MTTSRYHDDPEARGDCSHDDRFRDEDSEEELELAQYHAPDAGTKRNANRTHNDDGSSDGEDEHELLGASGGEASEGNGLENSRKGRRRRKPRSSSCRTVLLAFCLGAVLGCLTVASVSTFRPGTPANPATDAQSTAVSAAAPSTHPPETAAECSCSGDEQSGVHVGKDNVPPNGAPVVSYAFLQTEKGKAVMEDLMSIIEEDQSPRRALEKALQYMESDDQINSSCHPMIHVVGRKTLHMIGFEGAIEELRDEEPTLLRICNAAFMHGVVETYLALAGKDSQPAHRRTDDVSFAAEDAVDSSMQSDHGRLQSAAESQVEGSEEQSGVTPSSPLTLAESVEYVQKTLCEHIDDRVVRQGTWECHHGIGHGVLQNIRNEKIRDALTAGTRQCKDSLSVHVNPTDCENGLWMDHFASTPVAGDLLVDTFIDVCDLASSSGAAQCYLYAATEYLLHFPRDYQGASDACERQFSKPTVSRNDYYLKLCLAGVGTQAMKENLGDFELAERVCMYPQEETHRSFCMNHVMSFYVMATGREYSKSMCDAVHSAVNQSVCLKHAKLP